MEEVPYQKGARRKRKVRCCTCAGKCTSKEEGITLNSCGKVHIECGRYDTTALENVKCKKWWGSIFVGLMSVSTLSNSWKGSKDHPYMVM